ncbi:MAG: hypothetical protein ACM3SS_22865 [Rhodospirillaceae bacterium]
MKNTLVAVLLLAGAASLSWGAPWDSRRGGPEPPRGPQREQAGPWRGPPPDRRMERDDRRDGRLSDEERRGLHQDLDRANRELYRRR